MNHQLASGFMKGSKLPPILSDLTFVFVPIQESEPGAKSITYTDLNLSQWVQNPQMYVHYDPEFDTFTYGDYQEDFLGIPKIRATNLYKLGSGDILFFFANFEKHDGQKYLGETGFYFIGFFELAEPPAVDCSSVLSDPKYNKNAHCRRNGDYADIFKGTENSMRFARGVLFDKELANIILRTRKGDPLPFGSRNKQGRLLTDLEVINSATKTARLIESDERKEAFEKAIKTINPEIQI